MAAADRVAVAAAGFAAWQSSDAFIGDSLSMEKLDEVRRAYVIFAAEAVDKIVVAELDGQLAGWTAREGERDYISDLWVHPDVQGQGVGRALIEHLLFAMRREKIKRARIHTHARNSGAIRLYRRCGFTVVWQGIEYSRSMKMDLEKVHLEMPLLVHSQS